MTEEGCFFYIISFNNKKTFSVKATEFASNHILENFTRCHTASVFPVSATSSVNCGALYLFQQADKGN